MPLSPGDRFDRYVIEELLGEGGMARVYRAHDPRLHRRVALKVLRVDSSRSPESADDATSRLMREARAAAALDHPNAVSVFDVGEADGELFIAMELVNGKSLRAYVGDASVRWDTKLRWMVDAARALGAAHERGLVHRDVKPENVMVRSDGVVKVLDFGIAKRVDIQGFGAPDDARTQSGQGGIVGTPWYLSPEQLRGDPVDGRADQFAWGVTTYELLTGQLPWPKGVDGFQLVLAILERMPEPPSKIMAALPSIVDATVIKTLAKAPSKRFEAMESVAAALEAIASTSRRTWAEVPVAATRKTDPAPPLDAPQARTPLDGATTLPSPSKRPPRRSRRSPAMIATVMVAAAAVALAIASARLGRRPPAPAAPQASQAAQVPAPRPTAMTDLPLPPSSAPEATAAFRRYLQSFRDADWDSAMTSLETAVEKDPSMAAAHLRLACMHSSVADDESLVRTSFLQAVHNRATLTERDAALLDALEPYLQREPSDPLESERRLEALRARYPLDAELAYVLGGVRYDRGDLAKGLEAFDAAIAIDPSFAQAWSAKGGCLAYMGRFDEGRKALDEAQRISRAATESLWYRAMIDEQSGQCAQEESAVRTWLARDPDDWFAYGYLARALAAEGKPIESLRTAFEQKWVRLGAEQRARREPIDRALLDMATGDFASAEKRLLGLEGRLASEPSAQAHAEPQQLLLRIAQETGRTDEARSIAQGFLARRDAWAPPHRVDDVSISMDPVPEMLGALAQAGVLAPAQLDERRGEWLRTWREKTSRAFVGYLWIAGWAIPTTTPDQAQAARRALADYAPLPPFWPTVPADAYVGEVDWLAGRTAEGIEELRRGTATCTFLVEPITHTRAWLALGQALEGSGDRAGACAAYRVVLDRWGHAKPRSVTAERARSRAAALDCR